MTDLCPSCGQPISRAAHLTERELDVLTEWWLLGTIRKAAVKVGIGQQRAKNLLAAARIRNGVRSNDALLVAHLDDVRSRLTERMSHNQNRTEAA